MRGYSFLLPSSFWIVVAGFAVVGVVVAVETQTETTRTVVSTGHELLRQQPLLVEATVVGKVVEGPLEEAVALRTGAFLSTMAKLVNESISKLVVFVTIIVIHEVTIGVGLLEGEGLHLDVWLQVCVLEGGSEGAAVGSHGRQLVAVGRDRENGNTWPPRRRRDEVTRAGGVLRHRGAWR